jgi:hypothetical protein
MARDAAEDPFILRQREQNIQRARDAQQQAEIVQPRFSPAQEQEIDEQRRIIGEIQKGNVNVQDPVVDMVRNDLTSARPQGQYRGGTYSQGRGESFMLNPYQQAALAYGDMGPMQPEGLQIDPNLGALGSPQAPEQVNPNQLQGTQGLMSPAQNALRNEIRENSPIFSNVDAPLAERYLSGLKSKSIGNQFVNKVFGGLF